MTKEFNEKTNNKIYKNVKKIIPIKIKYKTKTNKNGKKQFNHIDTWKNNNIINDVFNIINEHIKIKSNNTYQIINIFKLIMKDFFINDDFVLNKLENDTAVFIKNILNTTLRNQNEQSQDAFWELKGGYNSEEYVFKKKKINNTQPIKKKSQKNC